MSSHVLLDLIHVLHVLHLVDYFGVFQISHCIQHVVSNFLILRGEVGPMIEVFHGVPLLHHAVLHVGLTHPCAVSEQIIYYLLVLMAMVIIMIVVMSRLGQEELVDD